MTLSDRHDKRDNVKVEEPIHSILINKKLLGGLVDIIEDAYNEIKDENKDKYSVIYTSYTINEKGITTTFENGSNFLDYVEHNDLSRWLKFVILRLHSSKKEITINLTVTVYSKSVFIVEGNSPTWVFGKKGLLISLFENFKTRNDFFHSKKRWFAYIIAGLIFGFMTGVGLSNDPLNRLWISLSWSFNYTVFFNFFFGWLYPINETEYSVQFRLRRKILAAISAIFLGLIVAFIVRLIFGL